MVFLHTLDFSSFISTSIHFYLIFFFLKKPLQFKSQSVRLQIFFCRGVTIKHSCNFGLYKHLFLGKFKPANLHKLYAVLYTVFLANKNVFFFDKNTNFNYLPVDYKILYARTQALLKKTIKYFDVTAIIFLDFGYNNFFFKKLQRCRLLHINCNGSSKNSDISLGLVNTKINNYLLYVFVMNLYLKAKG